MKLREDRQIFGYIFGQPVVSLDFVEIQSSLLVLQDLQESLILVPYLIEFLSMQSLRVAAPETPVVFSVLVVVFLEDAGEVALGLQPISRGEPSFVSQVAPELRDFRRGQTGVKSSSSCILVCRRMAEIAKLWRCRYRDNVFVKALILSQSCLLLCFLGLRDLRY